MKYPHALAGVKLIFAAAVIALIGSVCGSVLLLNLYLSTPGILQGIVPEENGVSVSDVLLLLLGMLVSVLSFSALVLQLIGSAKAAKDENTFKAVIYMISVGLVVSLISAVFGSNSKIVGITNLISEFIDLFVSIYIVQGVIVLAGKLNNTEVEVKGERLYKLMIAIYSTVILVQLFTMVFNGTGIQMAAGVLTTLSGMLSVLEYAIYLLFLRKAKTMLAQS